MAGSGAQRGGIGSLSRLVTQATSQPLRAELKAMALWKVPAAEVEGRERLGVHWWAVVKVCVAEVGERAWLGSGAQRGAIGSPSRVVTRETSQPLRSELKEVAPRKVPAAEVEGREGLGEVSSEHVRSM